MTVTGAWTDEAFTGAEDTIDPMAALDEIARRDRQTDRGLSKLRQVAERLQELRHAYAQAKDRRGERYLQIKFAGLYPDSSAPEWVHEMLSEDAEPVKATAEAAIDRFLDAELKLDAIKALIEEVQVEYDMVKEHLRARAVQANGMQTVARVTEQALRGEVPGGHRSRYQN